VTYELRLYNQTNVALTGRFSVACSRLGAGMGNPLTGPSRVGGLSSPLFRLSTLSTPAGQCEAPRRPIRPRV
jgi:hypothetical protein